MDQFAFLIPIAGVLMVGAMSPGPSFLVVARNAMGRSRAHGIATAVGTGLGVAIFALLAGLGVTALLRTSPLAFLLFKLLGGCYLIYLASRLFMTAAEPLSVEAQVNNKDRSLFRAFSQGLIVQTSNPKTALVIAGIFAAFVPVGAPLQATVMVACMAFVIDFSWYAIVALGLSSGRLRAAYSARKTVFDRTAAVFLGLVGVRLLFSSLPA
ncbi:MAG: LysE family transporter [Gammaproteobacteria bacterium]|nr:LysE family transporter [Gammaproteobacteria bacterium]